MVLSCHPPGITPTKDFHPLLNREKNKDSSSVVCDQTCWRSRDELVMYFFFFSFFLRFLFVCLFIYFFFLVFKNDIILGHRQGTRAHAESYTSWSEVSTVASATVDLAVGSVVEIRRVQGTMACTAAEAPLVPYSVLRYHLLGHVDWVATSGATLTVVALLTCVWFRFVAVDKVMAMIQINKLYDILDYKLLEYINLYGIKVSNFKRTYEYITSCSQ